MSRQVRRMPLDFDWPLSLVWDGYLRPEKFQEESCPDCEHGYSPEALVFYQEWYGYIPFDPTSTGSTPFLPGGPEAQHWAKRQIEQSPNFYGTGVLAIAREAKRITDLWNGSWSHHLSQADVDALLEADRLIEYTHDFISGTGWVEKENPVHPTAEQVNSGYLLGFGHDAINASVCMSARADREGVPYTCATCEGHASVEAYPGQRAESEAWEPEKLPQGDGWQLWETVSEGSPVTPVFATAEELASYLFDRSDLFGPGWKAENEASVLSWVQGDGWIPSGIFPEEKAVIG